VRPLAVGITTAKDDQGNESRLVLAVRYEVRARGSGQILGSGTALVPITNGR
jgi:hypothetical protein